MDATTVRNATIAPFRGPICAPAVGRQSRSEQQPPLAMPTHTINAKKRAITLMLEALDEESEKEIAFTLSKYPDTLQGKQSAIMQPL